MTARGSPLPAAARSAFLSFRLAACSCRHRSCFNPKSCLEKTVPPCGWGLPPAGLALWISARTQIDHPLLSLAGTRSVCSWHLELRDKRVESRRPRTRGLIGSHRDGFLADTPFPFAGQRGYLKKKRAARRSGGFGPRDRTTVRWSARCNASTMEP
jgi:hypothetical protein